MCHPLNPGEELGCFCEMQQSSGFHKSNHFVHLFDITVRIFPIIFLFCKTLLWFYSASKRILESALNIQADIGSHEIHFWSVMCVFTRQGEGGLWLGAGNGLLWGARSSGWPQGQLQSIAFYKEMLILRFLCRRNLSTLFKCFHAFSRCLKSE